MFRNLLYLSVVLQEASRNVERNVGAVDHAVEKHQELGNDFLDVVGDEHLIAIQLYLSLFQLNLLLLYLGKIENPLQAERIIHIEVNPKQRLVIIHKRVAVEILIFLLRTFLGIFQIERSRIVDGLILFCLFLFLPVFFLVLLFALFLFGLVALRVQIDIVGHKRAIFAEEFADSVFLKKFFLPLGDMHDDFRPA